MKTTLLAGWLAVLCVMPGGARGESTVRFSNGDQISGTMVSLTLEELVLTSPSLEGPVPFHLQAVLDMTLPADEPEQETRHEAFLTLTNGDKVRGQLAAVTPDAVELDTWFAGRMKFNRLMISEVQVKERPDLIYRGPKGMEEWKLAGGQTAWTYQDGGFRSSTVGSIARSFALPDEVSVSFNAEWRNGLNLTVSLFSDPPGATARNHGYELIIQRRFCYLRNRLTGMSLGNTSKSTAFAEKEKCHVEIRASKRSGKICLLVDGELLEVWTDPDLATTKFGKSVQFDSLNEFPVRVSGIEIARWDGMVEDLPQVEAMTGMDEPEMPAPAKPKVAAGRMMLRNGDSITGEVLSVEKGFLNVKTPFREVRLPVESLRSIALLTTDLERCKREQGDVRAWFPDGSSIVFRLTEVGEGTLSGSSQNFGTAVFKMAAFHRIEFNIYDPALEEIRLSGR